MGVLFSILPSIIQPISVGYKRAETNPESTMCIRSGDLQLRAVFFDFVNTIAEFHDLSFADTSRNLHQLLVDAGYDVSFSQFHQSYTEVIKGYTTIRNELYKEVSNLDFIVATLKHLGIEVNPLDPRLKSIVNAYFIPFRESLRVFPGTRDTLATLKDDFHLKLGLVSNFTIRHAIHEFLKHLDLESFFDVVIVCSEVEIRKPHPRIFEIALEKMSVKPDESVFVGDDIDCDIAGANNIGMLTVQIRSPTPPPIDQIAERENQLSESCLPDYKVDSISELIEIVQSLR